MRGRPGWGVGVGWGGGVLTWQLVFNTYLVGTEDATSLLDLYDDCGMWWWSWRGLT